MPYPWLRYEETKKKKKGTTGKLQTHNGMWMGAEERRYDRECLTNEPWLEEFRAAALNVMNKTKGIGGIECRHVHVI